MNKRARSDRGDQTREALLQSAMTIFGRDGFHAASTRAIADHANVNQALIGYHFGGKEGLYLAIFESIGIQVEQRVAPVMAGVISSAEALDVNEDPDRSVCLKLLEDIIVTALEVLSAPQAREWAKLYLREAQDPGPAFDLIFERVMSKMFQAGRTLVAVLSQETEEELLRVRMLMLMGQVMVFITEPATTTRVLGWQKMTARQVEVVRLEVRRNLRLIFRLEEGI